MSNKLISQFWLFRGLSSALSQTNDFKKLRIGPSCGKTTAIGATATATGRDVLACHLFHDFFTILCKHRPKYLCD